MSLRVVVGITGATGAIYGVKLLKRLKQAGAQIHPVACSAGVINVHHALGLDRAALEALADVAYSPADIGAASIEEMVDETVERVLSTLAVEDAMPKSWEGLARKV